MNQDYKSKKAQKNRDFKIKEVNRLFNLVMSDMLYDYPQYEIATFDQQKLEADNLSGTTPIIDLIALAKNVSREEIAIRIKLKADVLAPYSGLFLAAKQVVVEMIEKMTDDEVLVFDYQKEWKNQILLGFSRLNKDN